MIFCSVSSTASIEKILSCTIITHGAVSYARKKIQFKTTLGFLTNQVACPSQTLHLTTIVHKKRTFQNVEKNKNWKNDKIRKKVQNANNKHSFPKRILLLCFLSLAAIFAFMHNRDCLYHLTLCVLCLCSFFFVFFAFCFCCFTFPFSFVFLFHQADCCVCCISCWCSWTSCWSRSSCTYGPERIPLLSVVTVTASVVLFSLLRLVFFVLICSLLSFLVLPLLPSGIFRCCLWCFHAIRIRNMVFASHLVLLKTTDFNWLLESLF